MDGIYLYTDGDSRRREGFESLAVGKGNTKTNKHKQTRRRTMQNEYIMTSIELDEQFVDNMANASINDPEYMTDEERSEANDFDLADEEIEETSYQMSDEEQEGLEQYLDDTRDDIPECTDAKVNLFWDTYAGFTSSEQRKLERREAIKRAKRTQQILDSTPRDLLLISSLGKKTIQDEKAIEKLNNHFNA